MEGVIGLFETECLGTTAFHDGPYKTISDIEYATMAWVDRCNNRRLHFTLAMVPPAEFEQAHYAALALQEQPACHRHP
jgi:putative transposase